MATILDIELPTGWIKMVGIPTADLTRQGKIGNWVLQDNDPYAIFTIAASYRRSDYETAEGISFDDLYSFFLVSKGCGFLVTDPIDNADSDKNGSGMILELNGTWRLFKRYTNQGLTYDHPITRPNDVTVNAGTLDPATGIVTGITEAGTWTGTFYRPMIFQENGLQFEFTPDGIIDALDLRLEEQLEV